MATDDDIGHDDSNWQYVAITKKNDSAISTSHASPHEGFLTNVCLAYPQRASGCVQQEDDSEEREARWTTEGDPSGDRVARRRYGKRMLFLPRPHADPECRNRRLWAPARLCSLMRQR